MDTYQEINNLLVSLYGTQEGEITFSRLTALMQRYDIELERCDRTKRGQLTQRDAILITYGDQLTEPGRRPLQSLREFCHVFLRDLIGGVHILPFFPFSSDDGFSIMDYTAVDSRLGTWKDITQLGENFRLMFDVVLNHISAESEWFKKYASGDREFSNFFIEIEGNPDLSMVVRPRALPLLTEFETTSGQKNLWTTFSSDQIDLNYHNPEVLLKIIEIVLFYVSQGAEFLRLDAIAYLWKEINTTCIHLPQTYQVIQLLRAVLDALCPQVFIITETNVPHQENLSYFGDGSNEAQLVYNFALPPLVLHTLQSGSARTLTDWSRKLELPSAGTTFFNFLASHDGIGLNPARGILTDEEIDAMVNKISSKGGLVSYKQNPDGSQSPYELNVNYLDALSSPGENVPESRQADRFIVSQAIMLALIGVPGIYFHSLFGSRGWSEGVRLTGRNRTINRQKFDCARFENELNDPASLRRLVFERYSRLLKARSSSPSFSPAGKQDVLSWGEEVFVLLRTSPDGMSRVLCVHNVTGQKQSIRIDWKGISGANPVTTVELLSGQQQIWFPGQALILQPYQVLWLVIIN